MVPPDGVPGPDDVSTAVLIYTTPFCGYCRAALMLLKERDIEHTQVDVSGQPEARRFLLQVTRQRTVPQIFVGGRSIGGYTELATLDRSGQLDRMMASAGREA